MTFPLFGSTLSLRAAVLSTDEIVVGDKAADPTGNTGARVNVGSSLQFRDAAGRFNGSCDFAISGGIYNVRYYSTETASSGFNAVRWGAAFTAAVGYIGMGGSTAANPSFRDAFVVGTQTAHPFVINVNDFERIRIGTDGHILPGSDASQNFGSAVKRVNNSYFTVAPTVTSDERSKTDIGAIPEEWLDAWAGVEWCRFKMVDRNRWHIGLVAQRVYAAFAVHDIDAFEIGLCGFDRWDEEREAIYELVSASKVIDGEKVEIEEQIDTGKTRQIRAAGDIWSLRYEECLAIEAAWRRRELAREKERNAALEERLAALEAQS